MLQLLWQPTRRLADKWATCFWTKTAGLTIWICQPRVFRGQHNWPVNRLAPISLTLRAFGGGVKQTWISCLCAPLGDHCPPCYIPCLVQRCQRPLCSQISFLFVISGRASCLRRLFEMHTNTDSADTRRASAVADLSSPGRCAHYTDVPEGGNPCRSAHRPAR